MQDLLYLSPFLNSSRIFKLWYTYPETNQNKEERRMENTVGIPTPMPCFHIAGLLQAQGLAGEKEREHDNKKRCIFSRRSVLSLAEGVGIRKDERIMLCLL